MAVKDHSLDEKIIKAATAEFMEHGYQKASLHKITQRAGITTGALYTRYKGKDDLFCSLVSPSVSRIRAQISPICTSYEAARITRNPDDVIKAIRMEQDFYLNLMFRYYDECVLFLCRSDGSSMEKTIQDMLDAKARQTIDFLEEVSTKKIPLDGVDFIITEQFSFFRRVLEAGYSKEQAVSCMNNVMLFLEAGWRGLLHEIM